MKIFRVEPASKLFGEIRMSGDKSISHRAIMCGAIAKGKTVAEDILDCDDCNFTMNAFREMGVRFERDGRFTIIHGVGLNGLSNPDKPIYVGNSGTSMRVLAGILAGQEFASMLTGDKGLCNRPMSRIIEPLKMMGACVHAKADGTPPLEIKPAKLKSIEYKLPVPSAQVKSSILFAGLYAKGATAVEEKLKSRDHTERMMKHFGADIKVDNLKVLISGGCEMKGVDIMIPGDISSASFFAAGAILLKNSNIRINGVSVNPSRAGMLDILLRMGARCRVVNRIDAFEPYGDIEVESGPIEGIVINESDIPGIIDELPIIFVLASLAGGKTIIKGAEELRVKETDRITSMRENLNSMGGKVYVSGADIVIDGVEKLKGADIKSFGDHRTVMAMTMAALTAEGASSIDDVECVSKSFPGFFNLLDTIKC